MVRIGAGEGVDDVEGILRLEILDAFARRPSNLSSGSGWLMSPHQIRLSEPGSTTTYLSFGERPVNLPVSTTSGPPWASAPAPLLSAAV